MDGNNLWTSLNLKENMIALDNYTHKYFLTALWFTTFTENQLDYKVREINL